MKSINNDCTVSYYDNNAATYYEKTITADVSDLRNRFLKYLRPNGRIIDIGAGSGRDMIYFESLGYELDGIDASKQLCDLVFKNTGILVENIRIQEWKPQKYYDGIWACASLVHLNKCDLLSWFKTAERALYKDGAIFISMKEGVENGFDADGRYFINFNDEILNSIVMENDKLIIKEDWYSKDLMERKGFRWRNVIFSKRSI